MPKYRWVPLKPDFLGAWKSVWLKHYLAYPVIIISLIMQRNLATKIRAKRESGLTAVRLKRDPPVKSSVTCVSWGTLLVVKYFSYRYLMNAKQRRNKWAENIKLFFPPRQYRFSTKLIKTVNSKIWEKEKAREQDRQSNRPTNWHIDKHT